jgi:hypothetical protein
MIGAMAAKGGKRERKLLPPTVKAAQVKALQRTRKSPNVEAIRKMEGENTPFEMIRKIPEKPRTIPVIFLHVIFSPRKRRALRAMKMGWMAMIHPVLIAVV